MDGSRRPRRGCSVGLIMMPAKRLSWLLFAATQTMACATYREPFVITTRTRVEVSERPQEPAGTGSLTLLPMTPGRLDADAVARALDGYGHWEESAAYGAVWIPVEALTTGFVPYLTNGQWMPSAAGWYWQSGYAWGRVTFHYGRWVQIGGTWAWVPGASFAPAWVDWRVGNGWAGWAPLAPVGAAWSSPYVYCALSRLAGPGLVARAVTGVPAVSLYAGTVSVRPRLGYGATVYSPGPPLPEAQPVDVARYWGQVPEARPVGDAVRPAVGVPVGDGFEPAVGTRVGEDGSVGEPVGGHAPTLAPPPTQIADVPSVRRVLVASTGALRPLDSYPIPEAGSLHEETAGARGGGFSVVTIPDRPRFDAEAPRRITWDQRVTPTTTTTLERVPMPAPARIAMPTPAPAVFDRSVSAPPSVIAAPVTPAVWGGWTAPAWGARAGYVPSGVVIPAPSYVSRGVLASPPAVYTGPAAAPSVPMVMPPSTVYAGGPAVPAMGVRVHSAPTTVFTGMSVPSGGGVLVR